LIAHFNVIIGGVLFGVMAAVTYWYPKAFGYKLNEFWGRARSGSLVLGFTSRSYLLYVLGLMGDPPHEPL
jgi:cytochrome o ubiquinol oxidase subunit 1